MFEKLKKNLSWLFFCNHCRYCSEVIGRNEEVCEDCYENLPRIVDVKCKFCGAEKTRCNCRKHKNKYDGITSPFYYEGKIGKCIRDFKFNGRDFYGKALAQDMAESVKNDFKSIDFDLVCYVPFTKNQQRKRKYNQSEIFAKHLSGMLNIPMKPVMVKIFDNLPQHSLNVIRRRGNVSGVYDVCEDVNSKTILLVDDIKTTGATLDACATILKIRGAEKVYCVTAALAGVKKKEEKTE